MSETTPHPEPPESDEELEDLLRGLKPNALNVEFLGRLQRVGNLVSSAAAHGPTRPQWRKVIPLTLACVLVMFGYAFYQYGPHTRAELPEVATAEPIPAMDSDAPAIDRFEPVSVQGYLVNTSSGGIVETEEGPRERMNLEYRDAYHWRDPATGTNIRFFQPRQEEMIVPLQTD